MRSAGLLCIIVPALSLAQAHKVDLKAEEAAIRALIANPKQIKYTVDSIQWNGARKRTSNSSKMGDPDSAAAVGKRRNSVTRYEVQRIDMAASGDMACEFSNGKLDFDVEGTPVRHQTLDQGVVRVWRKIQGEWKVTVMFARPLDLSFEQPPPAAGK